jgi:hypothetical protein
VVVVVVAVVVVSFVPVPIIRTYNR